MSNTKILIKTHEQLELLQQLGCPIAQGYVFARPLPGPGFINWLRQHKQAHTLQRQA